VVVELRIDHARVAGDHLGGGGIDGNGAVLGLDGRFLVVGRRPHDDDVGRVGALVSALIAAARALEIHQRYQALPFPQGLA
jgi:hypothetical protein